MPHLRVQVKIPTCVLAESSAHEMVSKTHSHPRGPPASAESSVFRGDHDQLPAHSARSMKSCLRSLMCCEIMSAIIDVMCLK